MLQSDEEERIHSALIQVNVAIVTASSINHSYKLTLNSLDFFLFSCSPLQLLHITSISSFEIILA